MKVTERKVRDWPALPAGPIEARECLKTALPSCVPERCGGRAAAAGWLAPKTGEAARQGAGGLEKQKEAGGPIRPPDLQKERSLAHTLILALLTSELYDKKCDVSATKAVVMCDRS